MFFRISTILLVLFVAAGQQVFRSGTELVEVDAVVLDRSGQAVRGLTAADFEILDEGDPQEISTFAFIEVPPRAFGVPGESGVASTVSQRAAAVYLIVLDYLHTPSNTHGLVRDRAREFVRDYMGPSDLAAVVHLGLSTGGIEFSGNKPRLLATIDDVKGSGGNVGENPTPDLMPTGIDHADAFNIEGLEKFERMLDAERVERSYEMLGRVVQHVGGFTGRRKSMLLFSSGVPIPLDEQISPDPSRAERASRFARSHAALVRRATQSNVNLNTIRVRGLDTSDSDSASMDSLRMLADETGGRALLSYNRMAEPFQQLTIDNGSYYLLGFRPKQPVDEARFRRLTVRVKRDGVQVMARRGYGRASPNDESSATRALENAWAGTSIGDLLDRPLPTLNGGLPMRALASVIRRSGTKALVLLAVEIDNGSLGPDAEGIEVGFRAIDPRGRVAAGRSDTTRLNVSDATRAAIQTRGWRYLTTLEVDPGSYQLRVAVRETRSAAGGSAFLDLEIADLQRTPLSVESVLLGSAARTMPTAAADARLLEAWPVPPTARREFDRSETLSAFIKLSGASGTPVEVNVAIDSADGRGMLVASREIPASQLSRDAAAIPLNLSLAPFEPGEYLMRIAVSPAGAATPASVRHVVFRVR